MHLEHYAQRAALAPCAVEEYHDLMPLVDRRLVSSALGRATPKTRQAPMCCCYQWRVRVLGRRRTGMLDEDGLTLSAVKLWPVRVPGLKSQTVGVQPVLKPKSRRPEPG